MQWAWHILKALKGPLKGLSGFPPQHCSSFLLAPNPGVKDLVPSLPSAEWSYLPSWITSIGFRLRLYHLDQNNLGYLLTCRFLGHTTSFYSLMHPFIKCIC